MHKHSEDLVCILVELSPCVCNTMPDGCTDVSCNF